MSVPPLWLRWCGVGLGIAIFFWLSIEDINIDGPLFLAMLLCLWGGITYGMYTTGKYINYMVVGFWSGLGVGPVGMLLMIFKSGLHGHGIPDFSVSQMMQTINTIPYFAVSGMLLGWGIKMWHLSRRK